MDNVPPGQKFRLVNGQETLIEMQVTGQADNGMSESLYPIKGFWGGWTAAATPTNIRPSIHTSCFRISA